MKNTKKLFLGILIFSLLYVLAACGKNKEQIATLELKSNPTTGYSWYASQSPELFEINSEYIADSSDPDLVGCGGKDVFTLKPLKAGSCEVSFVYQRPWETTEPADTYVYQITVTDDLRIQVNGGSAGLSRTANGSSEVPEFVIASVK